MCAMTPAQPQSSLDTLALFATRDSLKRSGLLGRLLVFRIASLTTYVVRMASSLRIANHAG
eukprot:1664447-Ditylum_brightwellii.AAC.1